MLTYFDLKNSNFDHLYPFYVNLNIKNPKFDLINSNFDIKTEIES